MTCLRCSNKKQGILSYAEIKVLKSEDAAAAREPGEEGCCGKGVSGVDGKDGMARRMGSQGARARQGRGMVSRVF